MTGQTDYACMLPRHKPLINYLKLENDQLTSCKHEQIVSKSGKLHVLSCEFTTYFVPPYFWLFLNAQVMRHQHQSFVLIYFATVVRTLVTNYYYSKTF